MGKNIPTFKQFKRMDEQYMDRGLESRPEYTPEGKLRQSSRKTLAIFVMNDGGVQIDCVSANDITSYSQSLDPTLTDHMKSINFVEYDGDLEDGRISIDPSSGRVFADGEASLVDDSDPTVKMLQNQASGNSNNGMAM
tara:strand:+ start:314 stop:727 length:414 start_codon:yes stop_codon:yes gene_type:complete